MNSWSCSILTTIYLYFLLMFLSCTSSNTSSHSLLDKILLDCGSSESLSFNGKYWTGDVGSKFIAADSIRTAISVASTRSNYIVPRIPYSTARIFHFRFTYVFPFSPGYKYILLHFYPAPYSGLGRTSEALFSVVSGNYTLLNNFNPTLTADTSKSVYFAKGFVVNLKENLLNITFIPSPNAYAFVNGIEIYNFPANFYNHSVYNGHAFEMLHRVNVGTENGFTKSIWDWLDDSSYLLGSMKGEVILAQDEIQHPWNMSEYGAPPFLYESARTMGSDDAVNMSYNLTWTFNIDPGFKYLVRLHFCEIAYEVSEPNQRVFTVYINNKTVENSLDVVASARERLAAIHRDYIVEVPDGAEEKQDLWLALHPNTESEPMFKNAILNGVEIIKLSDANNNLASKFQPRIQKRTTKIPLGVILGGIFGCIGGIFVFCFFLYRLMKRNSFCSRYHSQRNSKSPAIRQSRHCHEFTLADIRAATNNFSEALVIGVGGFGKVYKGVINGAIQVAIKRKHSASHQGMQEFVTEVNLLSTFCQANLVSLLGFCQENNELILVYDYMSNGTVRDHLYKKDHPPLPWDQRLKICIGAARGLHYLHTGTEHSIIHRDIKSSNILLDGEWVAKVSDFGLSRVGSTTASRTHVKTEVKGTFGYLDPVYYRTRTLSKKSDVYSFGVLMLEVLCARPAVVEGEDIDRVSLAEWSRRCHQSGTIDCIVDPFLRGKIGSGSLNTFVEIAVKCLAEQRVQRPLMSDVIHSLELSLQLQERDNAGEVAEHHQSMI